MSISKLSVSTLIVSACLASAIEMPYAHIAVPGGESPDRRVADSLNTIISPIRVNQAGYLPGDPEKLLYVVGTASTFEVVKVSDSSVVASGSLSSTGTTTASSIKIVASIDASKANNIDYSMSGTGPGGDLRKGFLPGGLPEDTPLRIRVGSDYSADFIISEKVYTYARNAVMRFFGLQQSKHTKDGLGSIVTNNGAPASASGLTSKEGALAGGWYDCGDHLKESQTQSYTAAVLAIMAATHSAKDQDEYDATQSDPSQTDGVPDMLAEAKHGADFVLAAYDFAQGVIDNMPVSIGNFGSDHSFWGTPAIQEALTSVSGRGGPLERDVRLGELGSNISSEFAANLAIVSKLYAPRDALYAAKCLKVAQELYDFAKALALGQITPTYNTKAAGWSSAAYNGNNESNDDLGLAAIALLYATQDTKYLYDAVEDPALVKGQNKASFSSILGGAGAFRGGWFTAFQPSLLKNSKNTSWANSYMYTLYAFYKLILSTQASADLYGITSALRLQYIEDVLLTMDANLGSIASGTAKIVLPVGALGSMQYPVGYDPIWFKMFTEGSWIYNRYQAGNIFDVLAYADVAQSVEGVALPNLGVKNWKSKELRQVGVHQMDYLMGLNPWDISFIYGIGDKNDMHPHHRQANPEGRSDGFSGSYTVPDYGYHVPVGGLYGGMAPGATNDLAPSRASWEDYYLSEVCLDGSTTLLAGLTILADTSRVHQVTPVPKLILPKTLPWALKAQVSGSSLYVDVQLPQSQEVEVRLLAIDGQTLMHRVLKGNAGINHWVLGLETKPAGLSVIRVKAGNLQKSMLVADMKIP